MNTETSKYAGHSPAPWTRGQEYSDSQDEIESADGRCIAVVWTRKNSTGMGGSRACYKDDAEGNANGLLLADAPIILAQRDALADALRRLADVIDKAGLQNLMNGVQLGPMSWYHKANDCLSGARYALAKIGGGE